MDLDSERLAEGRTIREALADAIHRTMPSARIVGDDVSDVDFTAVVARLFDAYADAILSNRTEGDLGVTRLTEWLEARGETIGRQIVKAFKEELMFEAGRRHFGTGHQNYAAIQHRRSEADAKRLAKLVA